MDDPLRSRHQPHDKVNKCMEPRIDAKSQHATAGKVAKRTRARFDEPTVAPERSRTNLLALMGNEIKAPLNAVMTLSQLLLDDANGSLSGEQRRYIEIINRSGDSVLRLLSDFLDLARLEARNLPLSIEAFDVRDAIRRVTAALGAHAESKGLELMVTVSPSLPAIYGDVGRVGQVLTNLIGNAIKYTDKGRVMVTTELFDRSVAVHIADTGLGIPRAAMEGLFKEFFQVDPAEAKKRGGCGLGLAISKRLVTLMGGDIWASSKVGEGSRFSFTLPREPLPRDLSARWNGNGAAL
jgi:signal transduction histidine kinase